MTDWLEEAKTAYEGGDHQRAQSAALIAHAEALRAILGAIVTVETDEEGWRGGES